MTATAAAADMTKQVAAAMQHVCSAADKYMLQQPNIWCGLLHVVSHAQEAATSAVLLLLPLL
jgi:hypothetical protein